MAEPCCDRCGYADHRGLRRLMLTGDTGFSGTYRLCGECYRRLLTAVESALETEEVSGEEKVASSP